MRLTLTTSLDPLAEDSPVEVVERKGLGHPDTICDALAEEVSRGLCMFYRENLGTILHHNVDKVLLVGGESSPHFGGGTVTTPMEIYLAGRATRRAAGIEVPIEEIVRERCTSWLRTNLRYLDVDAHVRLHSRIRGGSAELQDLFHRQRDTSVWTANDTSCGAGFAPLTPLERDVLRTEQALRAPAALAAHPERGEDLKLMAVRRGEHADYTVAAAMVDRHLPSLAAYLEAREAVAQDVRELTGQSAVVNAADDPDRGAVYLTVVGTSAESGDDGQAGRGNRSTGLITPGRPMTMESVAGKNPVSHVGKIYNVMAGRIAAEAVGSIDGLRGLECLLVSRIGAPVSEPQLVHGRCWLEPGCDVREVEQELERVVSAQLEGLDALCDDFVEGRVRVA